MDYVEEIIKMIKADEWVAKIIVEEFLERCDCPMGMGLKGIDGCGTGREGGLCRECWYQAFKGKVKVTVK